MPYDPQRHHRRSIRLPGYDYTQAGRYFITIVTHERACLFGEVVNGAMRLNAWGEIVRAEWFQTAVVRPYVVLDPDEFVVMPNHVHGIIWIVGDDGGGVGGGCRGAAPLRPYDGDGNPPQRPGGVIPNNVVAGSLGAIVRAYKSAVAKRINALRGTPGAPVWQRNYHEHIIRNEEEWQRIWRYIQHNPARWEADRENPTIL